MVIESNEILMTVFSRHRLIVTSTLVMTLVTAASAQTETPKGNEQPQAGWSVKCANAGKGLECEALQSIALRDTGQHLITISLRRNPDDEVATMLLHLPHGMYLPAGIETKVDNGNATKLPVQTCDARGCYAGSGADAAMIEALRKGKTLAVSFENLGRKTITVNVPLAGFTAAFEKLN